MEPTQGSSSRSTAYDRDAIARASSEILSAAEKARRDAARCRALLDCLPDGVAETDAAGVVRTANLRLAGLLEVVPDFLAGRPLLHFVARGDCRPFRDVISAVASGGQHEGAVIRFRPRRGASVFPAEIRARAVGAGHRCAMVWTVRPCEEPRPREQESPGPPDSLQALVSAARETLLVVAAARRITVTHARPTTLRVDAKRARALLDAMVDVARVALRLARDGATLPIDIQALDGDEAVVAFGPTSMRVPLCADAAAIAPCDELQHAMRRAS